MMSDSNAAAVQTRVDWRMVVLGQVLGDDSAGWPPQCFFQTSASRSLYMGRYASEQSRVREEGRVWCNEVCSFRPASAVEKWLVMGRISRALNPAGPAYLRCRAWANEAVQMARKKAR